MRLSLFLTTPSPFFAAESPWRRCARHSNTWSMRCTDGLFDFSFSALIYSGTHEPSTTKRIARAQSQPRGLFFFFFSRAVAAAPVINSVMRAFRRPLFVFLPPEIFYSSRVVQPANSTNDTVYAGADFSLWYIKETRLSLL